MSSDRPGLAALADGDGTRDTRPDPELMPAGFAEWSRAEQADWIDGEFYRARLLERVLRMADYPVEDLELDTDSKVTGEMLAAIYAELRGFDHD